MVGYVCGRHNYGIARRFLLLTLVLNFSGYSLNIFESQTFAIKYWIYTLAQVQQGWRSHHQSLPKLMLQRRKLPNHQWLNQLRVHQMTKIVRFSLKLIAESYY